MGAVPAETAQQMGEYAVLRRFAIGGMAEIFLGSKQGMSGFERLVVLKRILPEYAHNQEFVRMFLNEARIAATLHHQNIVQVHAIGEERGQVFFAMEFLHGEDLSRVLSRAGQVGTPVQLDCALSIVSSLCAGLHYAHERCNNEGQPLDIVHRDVSPHNVFCTYDGGVKLLDFGIAKASGSIGKTRTGVLKGKVAYMSPEQAYSQPVDRRSDIFCIGILLWELTTGRRLYRRPSELETLKALVDHDAPAPSSAVSGYPPELEEIVMRCLARRAEDRWTTCEELSDAIERFRANAALPATPQNVSRMMRMLFANEIESFEAVIRSGGSVVETIVARMEATQRRSSIDDWDSDVASVIVDMDENHPLAKVRTPPAGVAKQPAAVAPQPQSRTAMPLPGLAPSTRPSVPLPGMPPVHAPATKPAPHKPPSSAIPTTYPRATFNPMTQPIPELEPTRATPPPSFAEPKQQRSLAKNPIVWGGAIGLIAVSILIVALKGGDKPAPAPAAAVDSAEHKIQATVDPEPAKTEPVKPEPVVAIPAVKKADTPVKKADPPKKEPKKIEVAKIEPRKVEPKDVKKTEPRKKEPRIVEAKKEPKKVEKKVEPKKVEPKKPTAKDLDSLPL